MEVMILPLKICTKSRHSEKEIKMKKRKVISLVLALCMLASLFGCGEKGGQGKDTDEASVSNPSTSEPANLDDYNESNAGEGTYLKPTTLASELTSTQRDVLNIGISQDATNWSPFSFAGVGAKSAIWLVCEPLGYYIGGEYIPVLMKEYWWEGQDFYGVIYDNIYDSLGNHMTADDIVFSYEMGAGETGTVVNFDRYVDSCEAVDEVTFVFHMNTSEVVGLFAKVIKLTCTTKAAYEASADGMTTKPVGTGPYVLANATSGYSFTMEKRDDYWQTDDSVRSVQTMANVNTINYYVIPESAQRTIALEKGTVDVCQEVSIEDLGTFEESEDYWIYAVSTDQNLVLEPNCSDLRPTSDLNLRLAICYAINVDTIVNSVFGITGIAQNCAANDSAVGVNEEWKTQENYYHVYDPELAKEYLANSDYDGEELIIVCSNEGTITNAAQVIIGFLEAVGITAKLEALESNVYRQQLKVEDSWDLNLLFAGSNGSFIECLNGELSTARSGTDRSATFIADDHFQELLATCMLSETSTQENLNELHEYVTENAYFYGLVTRQQFSVLPSFMNGFAMTHTFYILPGACTYTE